MSPLDKHLIETGETYADFARRAGVPLEALSALARGQGIDDIVLARRISRETDGTVALDTLLSPDTATSSRAAETGDDAAGRSIVDFLARKGERESKGLPPSPVPFNVTVESITDALYLTSENFVSNKKLSLNYLSFLAEGVINAFTALEGVTALDPHDRLVQALRPALEEIRSTIPASPVAVQQAHTTTVHRPTAQVLAEQAAKRVLRPPFAPEQP